MNQITNRLLTGEAIVGHIDELANLRLDIFEEYPYLYRGQREDELAYLKGYAEKPGACVILADDGNTIIGAATGVPIVHEQSALRDPFTASPYPVAEAYYIGELLFRRNYRNRGLGKRLLAEMEKHIRKLGNFQTIVCVTVERPLDHPSRPHEYIPISHFLDRTGFVRLDGIVANFNWLEVDGAKHDHTMQFWIKKLKERQETIQEIGSPLILGLHQES